MNFTASAISLFVLLDASAAMAQSSVYVGGQFRRNRPTSVSRLKASGFETVILFNVDVDGSGNLSMDGQALCTNGSYTFGSTNPTYIGDVSDLKSGTTSVRRIECCVGGWGNQSYNNIKNLINSQGTGSGTNLYRNFQALKGAIPAIDAINNDDEACYDAGTATSFHVMLGAIGYKSTLAPYMNKSFWSSLATNVNNQRPGTIDRVYIQCYDGGAGNNPSDWHLNNIPLHGGMLNFDSTATISSKMTGWKNSNGVVGGFLWVYNDETWSLADYANTINAIFPPAPSDAVATVYKDCSFGGASVGLPMGDYTMSALGSRGIANDDISSLKVSNGYKAQLYWDDNYTGNSLQVTGNNACLVDQGWNDQTTSMRVRPNGVSGLNGTYLLQNRNSGLMMDVANGNPANGTQVLQWYSTGAANQQFVFTNLGDGLYKIINVQTGKSVDVDGVSKDNFANVHIWDYVGGKNQQFIVQATDSGYYKLIAAHSSKLLEVGYASTSADAKVNQYDDNGQTCGQWKLVPVTQSWSTTIEAESYVNMSGIATEACSEGSQNVGWIDAGDWMVWDLNVPSAGTYTIEYRVASPNTSGVIRFEKAGGSVVYGSVNVPNTGGWQTWQTVKHSVSLGAGQQQVAISAPTGGYNLNWIKISK